MNVNNYFKVENHPDSILTFDEYTVNGAYEAAMQLANGDIDKVWVWRRVETASPAWCCNLIGHRKYREIATDMDSATDPVERRFYEVEFAALLSA